MPAAVAKGIIISISIIAALSIAVLENPQVQSWLEEQRRKIAELLRSYGQELDPESRRRAEAFAFEGRAVTNDPEPQRESTPDLNAVAHATGRSLSNASTIRRIPVKGPADPDEAEERRRKGREYLAKRNQQMIELQERRKTSSTDAVASPATPTSFDELVDNDGNLRAAKQQELVEQELQPPVPQPVSEQVQEEMKEVERHLQQPLLMSQSSIASSSGWQMGSEIANPFGDEYALERSITPRPASPRERTLERARSPELALPGSFDNSQLEDVIRQATDTEELTYEEQLAIAMSLSEQESVVSAANLRHRSAQEDADMQKAVQASLRDLDVQQATHAISLAEQNSAPLVDLSPSTPAEPISHGNEVGSLFSNPWFMSMQASGSRPPPNAPRSETTDELYSVTPELTRARLASLDAQQNTAASILSMPSGSFDHFPAETLQATQDRMDASFFSAASVISPPASSQTLDDEPPQLIDVTEDDAPHEGMRTPTSRTISSLGFQTDFESETLGSPSAPVSRAQSHSRSEVSNTEMVHLEDDSDVDMLSEEGDGIATPDSWSEVGSRDADSEVEENRQIPTNMSS